ncbi:MAG: hypothetical protein AAGA91_16325 [Pseudomonadota bacterium]
MKLYFLCQRHKQWLKSHPDQAVNTWLRAHDLAVDQVQAGDYSDALSSAGSALEAADIALAAGALAESAAIRQYANTAGNLATLLFAVRQCDMGQQILHNSIKNLHVMLHDGADRSTVMAAVGELMHCGEGIPSGAAPPSDTTLPDIPQGSRLLH